MKLLPLGVRTQASQPFVQYLFIKEHVGDAAGAAALFVSGLPLRMGERQLVTVFSAFGPVQQAVAHASNRTGMVTFVKQAHVQAALTASKTGQIVELPEAEAPLPEDEQRQATGLRAWVLAHKATRPSKEQLQQELDEWTEQHEAAEAARISAQQAAVAEDGWTVVVRSKGRKRTIESGGMVKQSGGVALAAAQAMAASKQVKPLQDFYRFQQRDQRRSELVELRQRFDEDRRRVASMRAARSFKPL